MNSDLLSNNWQYLVRNCNPLTWVLKSLDELFGFLVIDYKILTNISEDPINEVKTLVIGCLARVTGSATSPGNPALLNEAE